ncbi:MAG: response regulator transcription factor [Candidatus Aureabacteria bacterium]|nr:response regulator transcription factor [Candidatus Auribacterota bacterium]
MPYTILLVDDDKEFRSEFRDYLDEYEIVEASSGEEALRILAKPNEIDLVILDVMMPGMRGTEVLKRMKKMEPRLGIIILTGYSSKDVAIEALKGRADEYLEKPFPIAKAKELIVNLLESKNGETDVSALDIKGKIEKIKRFVERNCYKRIGLNDAAVAVCLSPKYLSRIFRQITGKSFSSYRLNIKIGKAKELLRDTGMNVSQISERLGYENAESFIRQFKQHTSKTPTAYRGGKGPKIGRKRARRK